jgi:RNA-splicing ligase RtcB
MRAGYQRIVARHPRLDRGSHVQQLGTLGTGNHFIEICLDEADQVWAVLHSGSRGVGNRIGTYFIEMAKEEMRQGASTSPTRTWPTCARRRGSSTTTSRRSAGRRTTRAPIAG